MIVICTNPDLANSAMWPNMETFVELALEDMLHRVVVVGFEFTEDLCVLGLVTVLWLVLLGEWILPLWTARGFMRMSVFETTSLTAVVNFDWLETALSSAGLIRREFRTVMRCAFVPLAAVISTDCTPTVTFAMFAIRLAFRAALGGLARLILAGFNC